MQISDLIVTPTYLITLPISKKKLKFRPFLVKEEKILLQIKETEDNSVLLVENVFNIINACIFNALEVRTLSLTDFEFLFLNIRTKSESSKINFKTECSHCQAENLVSVSIDDLKTKINSEVENPIKLSDNLFIEMQYPATEDILEQIDDKNIDVIKLAKACIKAFIHNDEHLPVTKDTSDEVMNFLECLTTEQFRKFKNFIDNLPTNYIPINFNCVSCGKENKDKLEGLTNFFI